MVRLHLSCQGLLLLLAIAWQLLAVALQSAAGGE